MKSSTEEILYESQMCDNDHAFREAHREKHRLVLTVRVGQLCAPKGVPLPDCDVRLNDGAATCRQALTARADINRYHGSQKVR